MDDGNKLVKHSDCMSIVMLFKAHLNHFSLKDALDNREGALIKNLVEPVPVVYFLGVHFSKDLIYSFYGLQVAVVLARKVMVQGAGALHLLQQQVVCVIVVRLKTILVTAFIIPVHATLPMHNIKFLLNVRPKELSRALLLHVIFKATDKLLFR